MLAFVPSDSNQWKFTPRARKSTFPYSRTMCTTFYWDCWGKTKLYMRRIRGGWTLAPWVSVTKSMHGSFSSNSCSSFGCSFHSKGSDGIHGAFSITSCWRPLSGLLIVVLPCNHITSHREYFFSFLFNLLLQESSMYKLSQEKMYGYWMSWDSCFNLTWWWMCGGKKDVQMDVM